MLKNRLLVFLPLMMFFLSTSYVYTDLFDLNETAMEYSEKTLEEENSENESQDNKKEIVLYDLKTLYTVLTNKITFYELSFQYYYVDLETPLKPPLFS